MILISQIADELKDYLLTLVSKKTIAKFKVFVRLNFQLEAYVFAEDAENKLDMEDDYLEYLKKKHPNWDVEQFRVSINVFDVSELEDSYYAKLVEDENTIDLGPRYRFNSLLSNSTVEFKEQDIPVVTFYSYKGGMGRTTSMMAYAMDLAYNHGKNVVIVDCDLEAPGYLNFFDLSEKDELATAQKNGFVEFICDAQFCGDNIDILNYIVKVEDDVKKKSGGDGGIWVVPAGNLNECCTEESVLGKTDRRNDYMEGLGKINLSNTANVTAAFKLLFRKIKESKEINPDIILIDSRTGFNDIFGNAAFSLSKGVVAFFGRSRQTEPGYFELLKKHCAVHENTNLVLAYSILPEGVNGPSSEMDRLRSLLYSERHIPEPSFATIHRNSKLELIGTGDKGLDLQFKQIITGVQAKNLLVDHFQLFDLINSWACPDVKRERLDADVELHAGDAERMSQHSECVKEILYKTKESIEEIDWDKRIPPQKFFYRNCMKNVFDKEKFVVIGNGNTGKRSFFEALKSKHILSNLKNWSGVSQDTHYSVVNVDQKILFGITRDLHVMSKRDYYALWQIVTWYALFFVCDDPKLDEVRKKILPKSRNVDVQLKNASCSEIENWIADRDRMYDIEEDLIALDMALSKVNVKVIISFCSMHRRYFENTWQKMLPPLIVFWQKNRDAFDNILPKVLLQSSLICELDNDVQSIISMNKVDFNWSIGEAFGYLFKLAFYDRITAGTLDGYTKLLGLGSKVNVNKELGQLNSVNMADLMPLVNRFFGEEMVNDTNDLPWSYFEKEFSNANRDNVSMQHFLARIKVSAETQYRGSTCSTSIISPRYYGNTEIRQDALEDYLRRLDEGLVYVSLANIFKDSRSPADKRASWREKEFQELLSKVASEIVATSFGISEHSIADGLKRSLIENELVNIKKTGKTRVYRFAPVCCKVWNLQD